MKTAGSEPFPTILVDGKTEDKVYNRSIINELLILSINGGISAL